MVVQSTVPLGERTQPMLNLWDRMPNETMQCYARFLLYRDQPTGQRSLKTLGIAKSLASRWSSKWQWVKRVQAWDDYLIALNADLTIAQALSVRARAIKFGKVAVDKAVMAIEQLPVKRVSSRDAIELAQAGDKLARTALGLGDNAAPASAATNVSVTFAQGFAPAWAQSPIVTPALPARCDPAPAALSPSVPPRTLLAERVAAPAQPKARTRKRTRTPRSTIVGTG